MVVFFRVLFILLLLSVADHSPLIVIIKIYDCNFFFIIIIYIHCFVFIYFLLNLLPFKSSCTIYKYCYAKSGNLRECY